jgi:hypothetical protein
VVSDHAFYGCSGLTTVTLPEGLTTIGDSAFRGCSGLATIALPGSVTTIGEFSFDGCSSLTCITLLEGLTRIGDSAFRGCSALTSFALPWSLTEIGHDTIEGCSSLDDERRASYYSRREAVQLIAREARSRRIHEEEVKGNFDKADELRREAPDFTDDEEALEEAHQAHLEAAGLPSRGLCRPDSSDEFGPGRPDEDEEQEYEGYGDDTEGGRFCRMGSDESR